MVDSQTVSDCKGDGFAPPLDDSLRAAAAQPFLYPQKAEKRCHSELA
jgi:hypothetical protein